MIWDSLWTKYREKKKKKKVEENKVGLEAEGGGK